MITVTSNIRIVIQEKLDQITLLKNNSDAILRTVAMAVLPEMKHRVHVQGKDSTGNPIGSYSPGYMAVRTGNYKNSGRVSKGPNKGKLKDAGTFTDATIRLNKKVGVFTGEEKVGTARPRYNRSSDTMVILSLTRQMENDLSIIDTPEGYGIGYQNPLNFKKALWCEATYKKKILTSLTKEELQLAEKTAIEFLPTYLKSFE